MNAIVAPISNAFHIRVWLNITCSKASVFKYIKPNMMKVDVATIVPKRT